MTIEYRVEKKYIVTDADLAVLAGRLRQVMYVDEHQSGECYEIRSLYFDDWQDRCMDENEAGIDQREKFRIRIYGAEADVIHLEIKEKTKGYTKKSACDLTRQESDQIMDGYIDWAWGERKPLNRLRLRMKCEHMRPKIIIAYERTAFVYPVGNVRITFDRNIAASEVCEQFFEEHIEDMTPVLPVGLHVLEVKYDEFLPEFIANELEIGTLQQTAFSKYYLGRMAVRGEFLIDK